MLRIEFPAQREHEIGGPLNGVLEVAGLPRSPGPDEQQQSHVQAIQQFGSLLLVIIDDIPDLAKIDPGRPEVRRIESSWSHCLRR